MSYDNCDDENKEKFSIDLDNIKRQLLSDQEKWFEEQKQSEINDNKNNTNNKLIIDEEELKSKIHNSDFVEYVVKTVKKTVKCEDVLIRQILYTTLSSYIQDDPINLGIIAPTSEGKTYPVEECIKFFPTEDVYKVGSMSTKVLVRQRGILIDKNGEPIEQKIKELRKRMNLLNDKKENKVEKYEILEEMAEVFEDAKTLIDLHGKILVFLEPPQKELWEILKPILSHDSFEIEFPFVNQTDRDGYQTKNVVVRGWPSCIFCSAKDESNWPIWPEIKSRFLITSPNMIARKYKESTKLISIKYGLPNLIQQQTIISNSEIELAKNCILLLKEKITELRTKNKDNGNKISLWIPYAELLERELPSNKGTDVRIQKRIFSLLKIVPIIKFNLRKLLVLEGETCVIASLEDLKEVLSITQNFEGIPKFKADFFNDIFYPCFAKKTEPDSNNKAEDDKSRKEEEIIAVTTRQLCDYYKEIKGKPISTDNLKHIYLNELINEGIIDYTESKINAKQYIYYPLVSTNSLSTISIIDPIDMDSQQTPIIYQKIITNITETWIFCEVMKLIRYRLDLTNFQLADYLNNDEKFQLLDNHREEQHQEEKQGNNGMLSIGEFIEIYITEKNKSPFDNKQSNILLDFAKRSPFMSILAKIDNKDMK